MQPAVPTGTLLQNHYRIVQLLGQGGFGRTYLAEDQGRFNERCAIKEFVPIQGEDRFSDKATQLFQREASVLYQISHPQIPKFRATFEEAERLFLVQDYVEGPTYHEVLNQRREQGNVFSEIEVRQFLQQLLPVLAHIHARKIIHRDISPDNIILRQQDQLPVLIDFGVVKEAVTRMQLDGLVSQATTVGKAGYAPPEQMQTGRAYPSSDLYSLAVTVVVLLTGKEPQALFDDINAAWIWQDEATVSPGLAEVLNKALSDRPVDRFGSVNEMAQALKSAGASSGQASGPNGHSVDRGRLDHSGLENGLTGAIPSSRQPNRAAAAQPPNLRGTPPVSQMRTVAVGRANPDGLPSSGYTTVNRPATVRQSGGHPGSVPMMPSEQNRGSALENPLVVGGLAIALAAIAGFTGWAVVQNRTQTAVVDPSVTIPPIAAVQEPEPPPKPTQVDPKPVEYTQPLLRLEPSVTNTVEGNMRKGDKVNYPLIAQAGQALTVIQSNESVLLSVLGPDGKAIDRRANRVPQWEGILPEDGEYKVQLSPVRGVPSSDYSLAVTLSPLPELVEPELVEPDPIEPDPTERPDGSNERPDNPDEGSNDSDSLLPPNDLPDEEVPVQPEIQSQRVSFPEGSDGVLLANNVGSGTIRRYTVNAQEGQIMSVEVIEPAQGMATFDVLMPGGEMIADAGSVVSWTSYLPVGGDYAIDVQAEQPTAFTLEIRITDQIPPAE